MPSKYEVTRRIVVFMALAFAFVDLCQIKAQDSEKQSLGLIGSFAPSSSHILIGISRERRIWTTGVVYDRTIWQRSRIRFSYEGEVDPFYQERDPTIVGAYTIIGAYVVTFPIPPTRVVATSGPIGEVASGGAPTPLYGIYSSEKTHGFTASPLGIRLSGSAFGRVQPTFSANGGIVVTPRDIPVDNAAQVNYIFSFGPGVQILVTKRDELRMEYLYRHISNANSGNINPGIDQGVVRVTMSRRF